MSAKRETPRSQPMKPGRRGPVHSRILSWGPLRGRSFESASLMNHIKLEPHRETEEHSYAIWKTPLWFTLIVALMLAEWLMRKWVNLA